MGAEVLACLAGYFGHHTVLGRARVVGPGGDIPARCSAKAALVVARLDGALHARIRP